MLKIQNKINPFPPGFVPPPLPWLAAAQPPPQPQATQPATVPTATPAPAPTPSLDLTAGGPADDEELEVDALVSEVLATTKRVGGGGLRLPPPVGGGVEGEEVVLL